MRAPHQTYAVDVTARPELVNETRWTMNDTYSSTPGGDAGTGPSGATGMAGTTGTTGMTSGSDQSTTDAAKSEARATGEQAKEGAKHVAEVGKDEAKNVARETGQQAKQLWSQTRSQLMDQSSQQQTRVAEGLRSLSQELSGMASGSQQQGVASDLAQQASQRIGDVASWLDQRDPGSLVTELKSFARQRPGAFLAAAAALGLVGGRLSRGLVAEHQESSSGGMSGQGTVGYPTGTYAGTTGTYAGTTGSGVSDLGAAGGYSAAGTVSPATSGAGADPLVPGTAAGAPTSGLATPYGGTTDTDDIPDMGGSGGVR
jgi:hypothetical protein